VAGPGGRCITKQRFECASIDFFNVESGLAVEHSKARELFYDTYYVYGDRKAYPGSVNIVAKKEPKGGMS
jgi:hypothetical protein